jgi:TolB-like protein/DNA-binding winged helix-turn-helix (wHTH) protein/Tfp pilus assembly protein PilF
MRLPISTDGITLTLGSESYRFQDGALYDSNDEPVTLRAKSLRMFCALLDSNGHIMSRDALADAVWPKTVATDESISQCVADIRRVLGDGTHKILETFPKRGYRLNAQMPSSIKQKSGKRFQLFLIAAAAALVAVGLWQFSTFSAQTNARPMRDVIAVLPFDSQTNVPGQDFVALGLAEDLTIKLAELPGLSVVPKSLSFSAISRGQNTQSEARTLGASYVVNGSVRQKDDRIWIAVELMDSQKGTISWARKYSGHPDELLEFRDDMIAEIADAVSVELTERNLQRLHTPETDSPAAFQEVLLGRRAISTFNHVDNLTAERHFRQAITLDPEYARAYAELAAAFAIRFENGWNVLALADQEKAFYFANKAVELDGDLWLAHYALGRLHTVVPQKDLGAAENNLERAMSLQPANDDARVYYAVTKNFQGKHEEAIAILEQVLATHPQPPFWYYLSYGNALYHAGRYQDAVAPLEQCLKQLPTAPYCLRFQIANYTRLDQPDDAEWAIEEYTMSGYEASVSAIMALILVQYPASRENIASAFRAAGLPD